MALSITARFGEARERIDLLAQGIVEVAKSKENTGGIVKIIAALGANANDKAARRFAKTPIGERALADRDGLLRILQDRDYLSQCPEGSLGRSYYEFVYQENLSADGLVDAVNEGTKHRVEDIEKLPEVAALSARFRDLHDLWHVTTGYGRDVLGEMSILFFSFAQIRNPGFAFISITAATVAKLVDRDVPAYRVLMEAYLNGATANWLLAEDWESMMERPVDEVRGQFGISHPRLYMKHANNAARLERRIQKMQTRISARFA